MIYGLFTLLTFVGVSFGIDYYRVDWPNYALPNNTGINASYALDLFEGILPFAFALDKCSAAAFTTANYQTYSCNDDLEIVKTVWSGTSAEDISCTSTSVSSDTFNATDTFNNFFLFLSGGGDTTVAEGLGWSPNIPMRYSCSGTADYVNIDLSITGCTPPYKSVFAAIGNDPCVVAEGGATSRVWCTNNGGGDLQAQLQYFNVSESVDQTLAPICNYGDWEYFYTASGSCGPMFTTNGLPVVGFTSECTQMNQGSNPDEDAANSLVGIIAVMVALVTSLFL